MRRRHYGLLTELQLKVLKLRLRGFSLKEIAEMFRTTRQNIAIIEKRAWTNIELAKKTLEIFRILYSATYVEIKPGTHLVDVPRLVIDRADSVGIKLRADFIRIYNEIRFKARECVKGPRVIKPITILIQKNGDIEVIPQSIDELIPKNIIDNIPNT